MKCNGLFYCASGWERAVVESQATMRSSYGGMGILGGKYSFGPFEVNTGARELSKHGTKVKLRGQPYLILEVLLGRAGEVVTRDEIRERLWPADTFVDFEHGLNTSVKKLRQVLCDSAEQPRYIETVPRLGYRFIAPVEVVAERPEPSAEAPIFSGEEFGQAVLSAAGLDPQNPRPRQDPGIASETVQQEQVSRSGPWQSLSPRWLLAAGLVALLLGAAYVRLDRGSQTKRLVRRETPRLCRGGSRSLTDTGVHRGNSQT